MMKALLIGLVLVFSVGLSCSDSNSGSNDGNSDGFGGTENFALYGIGIDGTFESVWNSHLSKGGLKSNTQFNPSPPRR